MAGDKPVASRSVLGTQTSVIMTEEAIRRGRPLALVLAPGVPLSADQAAEDSDTSSVVYQEARSNPGSPGSPGRDDTDRLLEQGSFDYSGYQMNESGMAVNTESMAEEERDRHRMPPPRNPGDIYEAEDGEFEVNNIATEGSVDAKGVITCDSGEILYFLNPEL